MFTSNRLITPTSMVSIWWNNISKISNVTMKSKVVVTTLAQGKQKVTHLTLFLDCILNHNIKWNNLDKCTSNHVSTEKIMSKPNLHFHDFSRWPLFDISNMFIKFVQHGYWYAHCYSIYQVSCEELIYYNGYVFLK